MCNNCGCNENIFDAEQCKHEEYYVIGMDGDEWNEGGENFAMLEIECESCGVRGKGETNLSYDTAPNREHNRIWWEDIGFEAETFGAESNCEQELLQCREALSRIEHITEQKDISDAAIGYIHNVCETVLKNKRPAHTNIPDFDAESFESEFSKGDMLNLKKYIDYPISWINKHIAPSDERKARKFDQKERGQIPTKKEPEDFRQSIKTPLWFKAVQLGILASVVGIISFKDISNNSSDEEPEEPEEQKEE